MHDGPADPDGDRMRRWAHGDRAAFAEIVRAWEGPVGRFAYRLTLDVHSAADITQEVFLRLFRAGPTYQDAARFKAWLYRVALNLCRDAARSKARKPAVPLTAEMDPPGQGHAHEDRETGEVVAAAVAALPAHLREVVVLRHYEDMSFEAMGRLLGVAATTLKSRFAVAMKELEAVLLAKFE
jgi:RNA polymerase sigma-70 factor, ECF subfamily